MMMRFCLLAVMAGWLVLLTQCSPKVSDKVGSTSVAPAVAPSAEQLAGGETVFRGSCGRCHKLFLPETRTVKQWNRILPEMYQKSKLDKQKSALVDAYVLTNAKKG